MLAAMHLTPIGDLAEVEPVLEQMGERSHAEADTAAPAAIATAIDLGPYALPVELREQSPHGAKLQIACENGPYYLRLLGHHDELLVYAAIAERDGAADPETLALGGRDLVAHPLADHLALELGKGEQHIERDPPHAARGFERLGDRHERDPLLIEQLDQLGEVGERAGKAVDLVDHHDSDLAGPNIGQELLQGSAVEGSTREPAIVVAIWNQAPALMRLALDIGLAGFPLGIERVEFEVEIMLGRFAGVDRAALGLGNDRLHGLRSQSPTRGFCAAPAGCDLAARIRRRLLSGADDDREVPRRGAIVDRRNDPGRQEGEGSLAGFPLGIERVEFEVEIMLGRFAGVDRAALGLGNDRLHGLRFRSPTRGFCAAPAGCDLAARIRRRLLSGADDTLAALDEAVDSALLRSPKKRGPFQLAPVMARAIVERLA